MEKNEKDMSVQEAVEFLATQEYMVIPVDEILTDLMNRLGVDKLVDVIKYMADIWDIK